MALTGGGLEAAFYEDADEDARSRPPNPSIVVDL